MDFVKEGKLDEEKKKRQAEWERVRTKEDPIGDGPESYFSMLLLVVSSLLFLHAFCFRPIVVSPQKPRLKRSTTALCTTSSKSNTRSRKKSLKNNTHLVSVHLHFVIRARIYNSSQLLLKLVFFLFQTCRESGERRRLGGGRFSHRSRQCPHQARARNQARRAQRSRRSQNILLQIAGRNCFRCFLFILLNIFSISP